MKVAEVNLLHIYVPAERATVMLETWQMLILPYILDSYSVYLQVITTEWSKTLPLTEK